MPRPQKRCWKPALECPPRHHLGTVPQMSSLAPWPRPAAPESRLGLHAPSAVIWSHHGEVGRRLLSANLAPTTKPRLRGKVASKFITDLPPPPPLRPPSPLHTTAPCVLGAEAPAPPRHGHGRLGARLTRSPREDRDSLQGSGPTQMESQRARSPVFSAEAVFREPGLLREARLRSGAAPARPRHEEAGLAGSPSSGFPLWKVNERMLLTLSEGRRGDFGGHWEAPPARCPQRARSATWRVSESALSRAEFVCFDFRLANPNK